MQTPKSEPTYSQNKAPRFCRVLIEFNPDQSRSSRLTLPLTSTSTSTPVKPFHNSIPDFITNPERCIDKRLNVPPENKHQEFALNWGRVAESGIGRNILPLPDYALNSDCARVLHRGACDDRW